MSYRKVQKMANTPTKYKKITTELKEQLRLSYVQGDVDAQGFRKTATIEELADEHILSVNTLYKLAQRENWKQQQEQFQKEYQEILDKQRIKEFALESKKFDSACLNIAKALMARVGANIRNAQNENIKDFSPQQLDQLSSAAIKIQKFAKLALGESTDSININANIQETDAFREAMELLDTVAESRREGNDKAVH
jgi:hypothetical protein